MNELVFAHRAQRGSQRLLSGDHGVAGRIKEHPFVSDARLHQKRDWAKRIDRAMSLNPELPLPNRVKEFREFHRASTQIICEPQSSPQVSLVMRVADIGHLGFQDDFAAADFMLNEVGVAPVPGSSFYSRPELGRNKVRFTFSKSDETIAAAAERLRSLQDKVRARRR